MQLGKLKVYFDTAPALSLLRSPHAPYIIDFLNLQFKQPGRISILHSDLLTNLTTYLEEVTENHHAQLTKSADSYLTDWCSGDSRWLRRTLEVGKDERVYQLTTDTEDVFAFLDRVLNKDLGFIGTESRLKLVIDTLSDLVIGSSDNPATRLHYLREQQQQIQAEIDQIEADGRVMKYRPAQIRERFFTAVALLRQLQGDFRAVEESFRDITAKVQHRQAAGQETRGRILEFALDAEDLLKQADQGVSFYEFVRLILSPSQTDRLEKIIQEVRRIPELLQQQEGLETVRGMVTLLQSEAEKVMRTTQRLSSTLRRLLDARAHAERQRITQLLRDIRGQALLLEATPQSTDVGLSLELDLAIDSPLRRTFWTEPPRFNAVDLTDFEPQNDDLLAAFRQLAALRHLDWAEMRDRIRQMLAVDYAPTLHDLLERHPADGGVVEIIGYLQIATEDGHEINSEVKETVLVPADKPHSMPVLVTIPRVTFSPDRRNGHAR